MTRRSSYIMNSDFDNFLFATLCGETAGSIGDESAGMPTTVLSALARLDLDPWQEAARLSALPTERAAAVISQWISRLPDGKSKPSDIAAIAARLADLLPRGRVAGVRADGAGPSGGRNAMFTTVLWIAGVALGAMMLFTLFTGDDEALDRNGTMQPPVAGPIVPGR